MPIKKSYFGFFCRYMTEQEMAEKEDEDVSDLELPR